MGFIGIEGGRYIPSIAAVGHTSLSTPTSLIRLAMVVRNGLRHSPLDQMLRKERDYNGLLKVGNIKRRFYYLM